MTKGRKSPTSQRFKSPLVRSKADGLHRAQRLKGLHFSDDLLVSRVHNAHARRCARKAAKSIAVDKVEVYAYRKPACKSYKGYATLASLLKRLTAQKSPCMTERLTSLPPARKIGKSASRFGSLESLLFAPAPLKSLTNAEKFGSRLVERRASKSATAFYALFVRENSQF